MSASRAPASVEGDGRDAIALHAAFAAVAVAVLSAGVAPVGVRVTALVVAYHLAVLAVARVRGHDAWVPVWRLVTAISVLQILPDAFLCRVLGVLTYGDTGAPKVLDVSVFMAGLWAVPLFPIVLAARAVEERRGVLAAVLAAGALSLIVMGGSEGPAWWLGLWRARNVAMVARTAVYILPAEVALGVATFLASRAVTRARAPRAAAITPVAALAVTLVFTGAAALAYLLVERPGAK